MLSKKLQGTSIEEWFKITKTDIIKSGGAGLLTRYNSSPSKLLSDMVPSYYDACRASVLKMVRSLNLSKVEDIIHVPYR